MRSEDEWHDARSEEIGCGMVVLRCQFAESAQGK